MQGGMEREPARWPSCKVFQFSFMTGGHQKEKERRGLLWAPHLRLLEAGNGKEVDLLHLTCQRGPAYGVDANHLDPCSLLAVNSKMELGEHHSPFLSHPIHPIR